MADINEAKAKLERIGDAIRTKKGETQLYDIDEMPDKILSISGGAKPEQSKTITPTASGSTVTPDEGYTLSSVSVNGDANLIPENVKAGVQIFDILGTFAGGGGLPSLIDKIDAGTFTVNAKLNTAQTINHNLGVAPDMWVCWANILTQEDYERFIESTTTIVQGIAGGIYIKSLFQRISSTSNRINTFYSFVGTANNGTSPITVSADNANAAIPTSTTFTVMRSSNNTYFKPDFTYTWVAIKFK